jgi:hypothetical protein
MLTCKNRLVKAAHEGMLDKFDDVGNVKNFCWNKSENLVLRWHQ